MGAACRGNRSYTAGSPCGAGSMVASEPEPKRGRKAFRHRSCQRRAYQPEEGGGIRRKVWGEAKRAAL